MKLSDIFSDKLSLSFEVFPPKTDTAFDSVKSATEEIAKLLLLKEERQIPQKRV